MSQFTIEPLSENNWREYKAIRLQSLQDSPDSFGSTYEREALFTPDQWIARLRVAKTNYAAITLAAIAIEKENEKEKFIGLVSCVINQSDISEAHVYQMWVAPKYRGMGVGYALVNRIKTWGVENDVKKIALSVSTENLAAVSLYTSMGFNPVGETEPLREGSALCSQPMEVML